MTRTVLVTGTSKGFGEAIAEEFLAAGEKVVGVSRTAGPLADRSGAAELIHHCGDATDAELATALLSHYRPEVLILNAGTIGSIAPITEQSWASFSATWETDVKATLVWCQAAARLRLSGMTIVIVSSGAAMGGSPYSGGYSGAKRMQWIMASYFKDECDRLGLEIDFLTILPRITGDTDLSRAAAEAYGERYSLSAKDWLAGLGSPFDRRKLAATLRALLDLAPDERAAAYAINGDGFREVA